MLGNPILDEAINAEAASMCINSNEAYNKIVHECVEYSKQIESKSLNFHSVYYSRSIVFDMQQSKND